jgi:hypothetical protein
MDGKYGDMPIVPHSGHSGRKIKGSRLAWAT